MLLKIQLVKVALPEMERRWMDVEDNGKEWNEVDVKEASLEDVMDRNVE